MNADLLLHQDTRTSADNFIKRPVHALIIEGKTGSGKESLAKEIAASLLKLPLAKLDNYQYLLRVAPVGSSIPIESIRQAQQFLKLKTTGQEDIRRVLIIEQAELMTIEAQNAFLKILEEPPADTILLILTSTQSKLLPTIRSRAQSLNIKRLGRQEIAAFFASQGHQDDAITAAYHAANAQIGLMHSILNDQTDTNQIDSLKQAKQILGMSKFDRLASVDTLSKQKDELPGLIRALSITCQSAMKITTEKGDYTQAKNWHHRFAATVKAESQLAHNPNSKLLLTDLLLNL